MHLARVRAPGFKPVCTITTAAEPIEEEVEYATSTFGPLILARRMLEPQGRWEALLDDYRRLAAERTDAEYLVTIGRKPSPASAPVPTPSTAPAELLTTVYHEARHAEQDFLVARHMAREKTAAEIAAEHEIPAPVAEAAKGSPLPADDPQADLAERLRAPVPDTAPDPELAAIRPRLIEKKARGEEFTPEEKAILDRAYQRYKNRPNEADAFTVQALAELGQTLPRT